jgi:hypothetical protein
VRIPVAYWYWDVADDEPFPAPNLNDNDPYSPLFYLKRLLGWLQVLPIWTTTTPTVLFSTLSVWWAGSRYYPPQTWTAMIPTYSTLFYLKRLLGWLQVLPTEWQWPRSLFYLKCLWAGSRYYPPQWQLPLQFSILYLKRLLAGWLQILPTWMTLTPIYSNSSLFYLKCLLGWLQVFPRLQVINYCLPHSMLVCPQLRNKTINDIYLSNLLKYSASAIPSLQRLLWHSLSVLFQQKLLSHVKNKYI